MSSFLPPQTLEGDLILISEDDADAPVVLAVLSPYQKRKRIPRDESTLLERADWSGEWLRPALSRRLELFYNAKKGVIMKKSIPFPPLAFEGDLILISEDDADAPVVLAVLSPYQKRKRIPRDESTLLERADWSGEWLRPALSRRLELFLNEKKE